MAWTAATRGDYVRPGGTYASDVTDRKWGLIAPLLPAARFGGRPRSICLRRVVNAIFYLLQTGCQWRMLPRDFPPRSTVYGYFRTWIVAGVWESRREKRDAGFELFVADVVLAAIIRWAVAMRDLAVSRAGLPAARGSAGSASAHGARRGR